ncbi:MAG TPA: MmpS family transport accessory protein [Mycobacterium sp.]|uniref:MmpS family transport accessory protein n=1 Tax=Mycolicibacterium sp. TaxID=2320850 RepID=UPI0025F4D22B|nr:MmpS family transport accessory protein [Mycolicibacterium sp.]HPX36328.1 MmpS family transport accessory protein [Mycobacterium sp.]HQC75107.1 MmpS family transport accessory protein [Mycobacterium sp.]
MKRSLAAAAGLLKRYWVLTMVLVALASGAAVVSRLRTFFDSDRPYTAAPLPADVLEPTNVKRVTYQIVGPPNAAGRVSYLDVNGKTMEAGFTELPWSVTVSTTDPGVLANVVAQGDTAALGCRILVNDKLVAEDYSEGRDAQAFCLDKAA